MDLLRLPVGPYSTNCYILLCGAGLSVLVDPGDEPGTLLAGLAGTKLAAILLTHGHRDHTEALVELQRVTGAPVAVHAADAKRLPLPPHQLLEDGQVLRLGRCRLQVHHLPGHTRGSVALQLSRGRWLVGDSVFPGGPGRTNSPEAFSSLMASLQQHIFSLPARTQLLPGHGLGTTVGQERDAFQQFVRRGWARETCGDVLWSAPASADPTTEGSG